MTVTIELHDVFPALRAHRIQVHVSDEQQTSVIPTPTVLCAYCSGKCVVHGVMLGKEMIGKNRIYFAGITSGELLFSELEECFVQGSG